MTDEDRQREEEKRRREQEQVFRAASQSAAGVTARAASPGRPQECQGGPERPLPVRFRQEVQEMSRENDA
jgi:hypothetical protein